MITITKKIEVIESFFGTGKLSSQGSDIAVACPKCDDSKKKKLAISLMSNQFHCWICGFSGRNIGKTIRSSNIDINSVFGIIEDESEEEEYIMDFPKDFQVLSKYYGKRFIDPKVKRLVNYLANRGISQAICEKYGIGYSKEYKFRNRVIIPSFDGDGEINYYTARTIEKENIFKYVNSKVPRKDLIFNEIHADFSRQITIVEGPFDSILGPDNSLSLLGSTMNESYVLFQKIIRNNTPIRLILDKDARKKQQKIANLLSLYDIETTIVDLDSDLDVADIFIRDGNFEKLLENEYEWGRSKSILSKIDTIMSGSMGSRKKSFNDSRY